MLIQMPNSLGDVTIRKFDHSTTLYVTVRVTREFKVRLLLAARLVQLAGWVLGCNAELKLDESAS
jgi:hypothetical protein